ncbi:MAG: RNA-binding protein [archaeon]
MGKKLYVGNLDFGVNDEKLRELFSEFGEIEEAVVISDKFSKRSKGFGFVTFANDEDADKAISEMNDKEIEGRKLKVNEAKPFDPDAPRQERPRRSFGSGGGRGFGNRDGGRQRRF